jgi:hypothetical protein
MQNHNQHMRNKFPLTKITKISIQRLKAGLSFAAMIAGLLLTAAGANAGVIFQADFNGPGAGTGGADNMVTLGGTGIVQADGTNTICSFTDANPFVPGGGNYLEVNHLGGGGPFAPVLFTFDSAANTWPAWQGTNITDTNGNADITLNGAYDVFFRVDSSSSTNDMSAIRTIQQYVWSDGGNGLSVVLNGQTGGYMILQIQNAAFNLGVTPQAITNFTSSSGSIAYDPNYDAINMYFNSSTPLTNGLPYHLAFTMNTDTNSGLVTVGIYLKQGTGAIDSKLDQVGWASFNLLATNLTDWAGNLTDICFTNQPWNFAADWAADGAFVADYAQTRIFNSAPGSFTALSGSTSATLSFSSPVISDGQITLSWTGNGALQWSSTVLGPWTTISPTPTSPYSEAVTAGNRFYRLKAQ